MKYMRVAATIDLDAIASNFRSMKEALAPGTMMAAVIKADGYGHGALPIAHLIESYDYIWGFAVSNAEEALELRGGGIKKPILILGPVFDEYYEDLVREEIRPVIFTKEAAEAFSEEAVRQKKEAPFHLALDTGMSRIGLPDTDEGVSLALKIASMPMIRAEGMFTHFARADETSLLPAKIQLERYLAFKEKLNEAMKASLGRTLSICHCSNSAGIMQFPDANLDMVRAGISLYGLFPSDEVKEDPVFLQPAMEIKSHISYVKWIEKGTAVSYGGTYVAGERTKVATVPVGYADGYPRGLSGKGCVLIRGRRVPIIGRICMDQFMVDVTSLEDISVGEPVVLLGRDGDEILTAEELGSVSGRFNYELVCDISKRVPRVYKRNGFLTNAEGNAILGATI